MSDRNDTQDEQDTQQDGQQDGPPERSSQEPDVQGVDTDPDDGKKSIEVDTDERLQAVDDRPDFDDLSEDELEKERQERLDPENRPDTAEVDNSQRTFNPETGLFEDSEVEEPPEGAPFETVEGEKAESDSQDSKDSDDMDPMDAADEDAEDPKDRTEATDAEQSKEAKESKDTES